MTNDVIDYRITNPYSLDVGYARIDEYFSYPWQMHEATFRGLVDRFQGLNVSLHVEQNAKQASSDVMAGANPVEFENGVAVISLRGPLMKQVSSMSGGTSTVAAKRQIRTARQSKEVGGILLRIESPGGSAAGNPELSYEIAEAAKVKPVWTFAEDLMASAAYGAGSRASKIFANATAIVGSIGTYMVARDYSASAAQLGIKVHVIRAGEMKGAGEPGTEISPAMLAEWQRMIDTLNTHFLDGISAGRKHAGLSRKMVEALADGRVYVGQEAVEVGLIDGIQTYEQTLAQLTKLVSPTSAGRSRSAMSTDTATPVAATIHELKQAFPKADSAFHIRCLESSLTVASAQGVYATELQSQLDAKSKECDKLKAKVETLQKDLDEEKAKKTVTRPGAAALADSGNANEGTRQIADPRAEFAAEIEKNVAAGMTRRAAASKAAEDRPDLQEALVRIPASR